MGDHEMRFDNVTWQHGEFHAKGRDKIGAFTMNGTAEDGEIEFTKQYIGKHSVYYKGYIDNDDSDSDDDDAVMAGTWTLDEGCCTQKDQFYLKCHGTHKTEIVTAVGVGAAAVV